jgi:hypothetical protein
MPGVRHDKMKGEGATNKGGHQSCCLLAAFIFAVLPVQLEDY